MIRPWLIIGALFLVADCVSAQEPETALPAQPQKAFPDKPELIGGPKEEAPPKLFEKETTPTFVLPGNVLTAGWQDGFFIRSQDEDFQLRITGQIQADYRGYLEDRDTTDIDAFLVRRARLGIEANMARYYEFRLLPDFGQGQSRVQDAYINVHYVDTFQVEAGKFKQPFSYEQLIQDRFVPFAERSLIDQLVPARDVGVMIHGQKLWDDRIDWAFAVSDGEINGDSDTNNNKDLAYRLTYRPFAASGSDWLRGWQLGMAGTWGQEKEPANPSVLRTPGQVRFFQFNPTVRADGIRTRFSPELVYFYKGFGFATQYYHADQHFRPGTAGLGSRLVIDVPTDGFFVQATLLLTGEERTTYSAAVDPIRPFDPVHPLANPGAWEILARVSRLEESGKVFARGPANLADITQNSPGATEVTLGMNWYLNKWVRLQLNWEHAWFNRPVQLGTTPAGLLQHQDTVISRLQLIF